MDFQHLFYRPLVYLLWKLNVPKTFELCVELDHLNEHQEQLIEDYNESERQRWEGLGIP